MCSIAKADTVDGLIREIEGMFAEEVRGVVLSSVHKAKGLEFDRVFVLDASEYMPSRWAKKDWEMDSEKNLCYVAATRAKRELRYIISQDLKENG